MKLTARKGYAREIVLKIRDKEGFAEKFSEISRMARQQYGIISVETDGDKLIYVKCMEALELPSVATLSKYGELIESNSILVYYIDQPDFDRDIYQDAIVLWDE